MSDAPAQTDAQADAVIPFVSQSSLAEPAGHSVQTTGDDLSPLVWRGLILTIVSLGFYRFWYRTDLRRWYWRNTIVGNDALEYRGTARELFIGFLIALAVVLPLYFSGAIVALFASENLGNAVSGLSGLIFLVLVQYGAYRSRRYRLTRTYWRGLNFDQRGSGWRYAAISIFWFALTVISLGLLFPLFRRALERYRINTTWFGSVQGSFKVNIRDLVQSWLIVWFVSLSAVVVGFLFFFASLATMIASGNIGGTIILTILTFAVFLTPVLLWPMYRADEFRLFTSGTDFGAVSFVSHFNTRTYYGIFSKFILLSLGLLVAWSIFLAVVGFALNAMGLLSFGPRSVPMSMYVLSILGYLGSFLIFSYAKETVLNQRFWRHAAQTLTILNLEAADSVLAQSIAEESATGEGLGDAFDFGGV